MRRRGPGERTPAIRPEKSDEAVIAEAEKQVARDGAWNTHQVYDRAWAEALLRQGLGRLGEDYALAARSTLFEALKAHLSPGDDEALSYSELSQRGGRSAVTLRKDVERLRNRYGQILRDEVQGTVTNPAEVDDELRYLCRTIASM